MKQDSLSSIWASIEAQRDALKDAKVPSRIDPIIAVFEKESINGRIGLSVRVNTGDGKFRSCTEVLKPINGEPIDDYMNRLKVHTGIKNVAFFPKLS
jgi:hypothetical protein